MYKVDLHTHSQASKDGALTAKDYRRALQSGLLDAIAVTDHNQVAFAQKLHQELGDQIIVGEEIMTTDGEVIGLYLTQRIAPGQTAQQTIEAIRAQGGLVCIPHPFEKLRSGIQQTVLDTLSDQIDLMEVHNGRASLDAKPELAESWSKLYDVGQVANSDAHGRIGWGRTHTLVSEPPSRENLVTLIRNGKPVRASVGLIGRLYPKLNVLLSKVGL